MTHSKALILKSFDRYANLKPCFRIKVMHTKLHTENKFYARRCADKKPLRLHAPRAAISAGTKFGVMRRCEKRLLKINYPGSGSYSQFTFDAAGRNVLISEFQSGTSTGVTQFVWCGTLRVEARNSAGVFVARYFPFGQQSGAASYFSSLDHLGTTRELSDTSANPVARLNYDLFGNLISPKSYISPDFGFAGYYFHQASGLSLTLDRAYNPRIARWLSRDPLEEVPIANLYGYVQNAPAGFVDPLGLFRIPGTNFCGPGYSNGHSGFGYGEDSPYYPVYGSPRRSSPSGGILGPLDLCCEQHDDCMNNAHHIADVDDRKKARQCCNRTLGACAAKAALSHPWLGGVLIPFSLLFGGLSVTVGPGTYQPTNDQPFTPWDFSHPE